MTQSEVINWSLAILLSLLVHSIVLMSGGARTGHKNHPVLQEPIVTRLSFNQSSDDAVPDVPRPIVKQQPRPLKKTQTKPTEPEPTEPEPAVAKPAEPEPAVAIRQKESAKRTEPARQTAAQQQAEGKHVSHSTDGLLPKERQQYLHKLMSHIESFKYYPRSARMRSLEGDVKVSFMLLDNGYYKQLKLDGAHSVLVKATRSALESAVPFPSPPEGMILPGQLELTMSYSLAH
jgi:protein TonB